MIIKFLWQHVHLYKYWLKFCCNKKFRKILLYRKLIQNTNKLQNNDIRYEKTHLILFSNTSFSWTFECKKNFNRITKLLGNLVIQSYACKRTSFIGRLSLCCIMYESWKFFQYSPHWNYIWPYTFPLNFSTPFYIFFNRI